MMTGGRKNGANFAADMVSPSLDKPARLTIRANRETVTWSHQHHCPPVYISQQHSVHVSPVCIYVSHQEYAITTDTMQRGFSAPVATGTSGLSAPAGKGVANVNSSDTKNNGHQNAKTTRW